MVHLTINAPLHLPYIIYPKDIFREISFIMEFFPSFTTLPRLSSVNVSTHASSYLTNALLQPTPAILLKELINKQTEPLKNIVDIFNMAVPPPVHKPPITSPASVTRVSQKHTSPAPNTEPLL